MCTDIIQIYTKLTYIITIMNYDNLTCIPTDNPIQIHIRICKDHI